MSEESGVRGQGSGKPKGGLVPGWTMEARDRWARRHSYASWGAFLATRRRLKALRRMHDCVSSAQVKALLYLRDNSPALTRDVALHAGVCRGSARRVLNRLYEQGAAGRVADPDYPVFRYLWSYRPPRGFKQTMPSRGLCARDKQEGGRGRPARGDGPSPGKAALRPVRDPRRGRP